MAMPSSSYPELNNADKVRFLEYVVGTLVREHGKADADWAWASLSIPEEVFPKRPRLHIYRDLLSLNWQVTADLQPLEEAPLTTSEEDRRSLVARNGLRKRYRAVCRNCINAISKDSLLDNYWVHDGFESCDQAVPTTNRNWEYR